jgi:ketosteroid isomerase-like protein
MSSTSQLPERIRPALVAVVTVASLAGCQGRQSNQQGTIVAPSAFRAEIDKLRSDYEKTVAAGDFNAMASLLADGAVMVRPGGTDWDSMAAAASGAPFPPGAKIAITPIEVVALSNEWAYEFGTATTTYTPEGAHRAVALRDAYLILFRNTGEGWQAYREVASSTPPPSGWPDD